MNDTPDAILIHTNDGRGIGMIYQRDLYDIPEEYMSKGEESWKNV